ncbi:Tex family protein [Alkalicoccus chagannorensis]|uniref:Tex family protein n=1 Tax=Alkalicoccus chagannorensis TaxID=427072 RepID=UPI0003FD5B74|nr:Tex family protein [Alkalicoccus chagannorensis]
MDNVHIQHIQSQTGLKTENIKTVISLSEEGNTVPFIARYRKEQTGGLDEEQIRAVLEQWQYQQQLEKRKEEVLRLIEEQDKLTEELARAVKQAVKLQEVEDLYRPYKQKRRTRAVKAKERGLEPLAELMVTGTGDPEAEAERFLQEEVATVEEALQGARDILAERMADDPDIRSFAREKSFHKGSLISVKKPKAEDEKEVFAMYYDYQESVSSFVPHRVLAVNRGEKEDILRVKLQAPDEEILAFIQKHWVPDGNRAAAAQTAEAAEDSWKRLIQPAVEREIRSALTEKAETQAIDLFAKNLRQLLLQPPLKGHVVLGVDPAYRTGCKLAVVNETGKNLYTGVIYPTPPRNEVKKAADTVKTLIKEYQITMIAIGNGTASRESEQFIADVIGEMDKDIYYLIVNEAGASVYSASPEAKKEFPDLQVEERSAISIARRLQDPLAELVKIDPQSVGVGQYQHDVSQTRLASSLTFVVETVVNQVGVNVNTASSALLQYVAGLTKTTAANIVKQREESGAYTSRKALKEVPRLGAKTYEQSIGFLRVPGGEEPLDETAIHPESYDTVRSLLLDAGLSENDTGTQQAREVLNKEKPGILAERYGTGRPTMEDILDALKRPARDPRDDVPKPLLKKDVLSMEDLESGMEMEGTVRNVVDFGAFVDIGVKQDGLVHISKLADRFIKHPMDVVSVGDLVTVWIEEVDTAKGRIALTMKNPSR